MRQIETEPSEDLTAIKPYLAEGHMIADQVVVRWHQDRRSSAYLNLDFNDDSRALSLDVALSPGGQQATIVVWRQEMPALDSKAHFRPPPEVHLPPEQAYDIRAAIDDDPEIVELWRDNSPVSQPKRLKFRPIRARIPTCTQRTAGQPPSGP